MYLERLELLPGMFFFSFFCAYCAAMFEIQVEGKDGWAKNLPAWKVHNRVTRILFGRQPLTGYHFWFVMTLLCFLQAPFFVGIQFSIWLELQIIAIFWFAVLVEDFLWFVLNPYFGIRKFKKGKIEWHESWFLGVPKIYFNYLLITTVLILVSLYIR